MDKTSSQFNEKCKQSIRQLLPTDLRMRLSLLQIIGAVNPQEQLQAQMIQNMIAKMPIYQPIGLSERLGNSQLKELICKRNAPESIRSCSNRLKSINSILQGEPLSIIDIGCNLGYFCFELSATGSFCFGIDTNLEAIDLARRFASILKMENISFMNSGFTVEFCKIMPKMDVALVLSLLHHILAQCGYDDTVLLLQALRQKLKRYLFLEMATFLEATSVSKKLPQSATSDDWIVTLLEDSGFHDVRPLSTHFAKGENVHSRTLFVAQP